MEGMRQLAVHVYRKRGGERDKHTESGGTFRESEPTINASTHALVKRLRVATHKMHLSY